jgi:LacI family transcriptional regulator
MERKPTMNDVARAAGVGTMTVSRVLNGSQHVSPPTAERVLAAVSQLGYEPNEMARALRNSKSRTIGLLVPNLHDVFYATCAHALNVVAQEHGYTVLLTLTNDDPAHEYAEARRMQQRKVEGIVVIPAEPEVCRLGAREFRDIPIVSLDRPLPDHGDGEVDYVITENERGARLVAEHLIQVHGMERIFFLGHKPGLYTMVRRYDGYVAAMCAAGLKPEASFAGSSEQAVAQILSAALQREHPPQALFSANNLVTRYILSGLLRLRVRVPEQIALVGFDDLELGDLLHPALTVVRQPIAELGHAAGRLLFAKLRRQIPLDRLSQTVLPVEPLIRHSCGCAYDPFGLES